MGAASAAFPHEHEPDFQRHDRAGESEPPNAGCDGGGAATSRIALSERHCRESAPRRWNYFSRQHDRAPGETVWFLLRVERAIDLAYAARKVFKDRRSFIVGEIIHNPEVNHQIASLGIKNLTGKNKQADISDLGPEDVVIVPAFGTELSIQQQIKDRGCQIVDTTCGDVMSVWKRVRKYASESVTSIIHGKAEHEETKATSSRALGDGTGITWWC
jgi:Penicillin tolerance protein